MIGRVLKRGTRVYGVLWYLYGPGKECVHSNPHLVSGWRHPAELEPPLRENGKPGFPQADRPAGTAAGAAGRSRPGQAGVALHGTRRPR